MLETIQGGVTQKVDYETLQRAYGTGSSDLGLNSQICEIIISFSGSKKNQLFPGNFFRLPFSSVRMSAKVRRTAPRGKRAGTLSFLEKATIKLGGPEALATIRTAFRELNTQAAKDAYDDKN